MKPISFRQLMAERKTVKEQLSAAGKQWQFNKSNLTLVHVACYGYEIDLERIVDSASALDIIIQISHKTWCDAACLQELVNKLDILLNFQGNYCSCGINKSADPQEVIERRLKDVDQ